MRFVTAFFASTFLMSACGDIIKAKNPFKNSTPHNPVEIRDPVLGIVCGNFDGQYKGTCTSEGVSTQAMRNVDQSFCDFFQVVEGGTFYLDKDFSDLRGTSPMTTRAEFVEGSDYRQVKLTEIWEEAGSSFKREMTLDSVAHTFEEKLTKDGLDSPASVCSFKK